MQVHGPIYQMVEEEISSLEETYWEGEEMEKSQRMDALRIILPKIQELEELSKGYYIKPSDIGITE